MTDKQIIEYKHMKCTKDDCCNYCGSIFCGYVDDIENLEKAYKAKEQECEKLKDIANRALDKLNKYLDKQVQLYQLKEQLEAYKMEAEEGKEINAELKAENERLKKGIFKLDKTQPQVILTEGQVSLMYCTFLDMELKTTKLKQTLAEIKEIATENSLAQVGYNPDWDIIPQKISECEVTNDNKLRKN
jgi:hypothetical protein